MGSFRAHYFQVGRITTTRFLRITERGKDTLNQNPIRIDRKFRMQYAENLNMIQSTLVRSKEKSDNYNYDLDR